MVWQQLKTVFDPEIPINIVDLGLIYECRIDKNESGERNIYIDMTLIAPGCSMGDTLVAGVHDWVRLIPTVGEVEVKIVFDPPWNQKMMS